MTRHGSSNSMADVTVFRPMGISAPTPWGRSKLQPMPAESVAHLGQNLPDVPAILPMMGTLPRLPQSPRSTSKPFCP